MFEPALSAIGWMCTNFGIERQQDWPAGAILAQADDAELASMFWICAQPVHLAVNRDELVLLPPAQLHLPEEQARALFSSVEAHCAGRGLQMKYIEAGLWCIGTDRGQNLATTEMQFVEGRSVDHALPSGRDARWWQRLIVELQMLLHEHPVNITRENHGEAVVNSLWLWGGGGVQALHHHFDRMCVRHPLLRAGASLSRARVVDAPCNIESLIGANQGLVEFEMAADTDVSAYLSRLESDWMAPAWEALGKGQLEEFNMVFALPEGIVKCRCDHGARRRFWKRRRTLRQQLVFWQSKR